MKTLTAVAGATSDALCDDYLAKPFEPRELVALR